MEESDFWTDQKEAQSLIKKANSYKAWLEPYNEIKNSFSNLKEIFPEALETDDENFIQELYNELDSIEQKLSDLEVRKMLSGELDSNSCYLSINAGAGGTESCDWVAMLNRMYQRWASKRGWKTDVIDKVDGEVAGIKSITLKIEGNFSYGYAKSEKGVHRLVRISPFDSNARRHTSFASVDVSPIIDEAISIDISPDDLKIDTFRSSGAGGQHVNTTDSAVRITHVPTNIIVSCQKERSQVQNKETCMQMIRSKLYEMEIMQRQKKLNEISGDKKEIAWGSQIRSYTFQPYTLVKDTRTKFEKGDIQAVMDGDIDDFINAYLKEFG
jgi:peptide chain release factor 2